MGLFQLADSLVTEFVSELQALDHLLRISIMVFLELFFIVQHDIPECGAGQDGPRDDAPLFDKFADVDSHGTMVIPQKRTSKLQEPKSLGYDGGNGGPKLRFT